MQIEATTNKAYKLLHDGVITLSGVEANGIKIDTDYLDSAFEMCTAKIQQLTESIHKTPEFKLWKKRYGQKTNMDSGTQLGKILFEVMDYECPNLTSTGKPKTDEPTLEQLDIPFVQDLLGIKKLKKARNTYLQGIRREITADGFIHPVFNLHLVDTFRSSSDSPNFQNMPIRNAEIAELIRQCFIARMLNRQLVEVDYGGVEIHGAAWYHKDPTMLKYLKDETKDLHRDMARQCYMLPNREMLDPVDKKDGKRIAMIRYVGKNRFVFPEFYGDWHYSCAPAIWAAIDELSLTTRNGASIRKWLKKKGVRSLGSLKKEKGDDGKWHYPKTKPGTFIHHIKDVEDDFWNRRFKVYGQWKKDWYNAYLKKGSFTTLTGFEIGGILRKNEVINYPVQGVAFHCLLWSLIRISKLLKKYRMKSLIVGQIHDSIVSDVVIKELQDYLEIVHTVMTRDIKKYWPWIITPLEIDAEAAPPGKSWFEKEEIQI